MAKMRIEMGFDEINMSEQRIGVELGNLNNVQGDIRI